MFKAMKKQQLSKKLDTTTTLLQDVDTPTTEQSTPGQSKLTTPDGATRPADNFAHRLLRAIASALRAALDDVRHAGWKRFVVCTITEFWIYTLIGGLIWLNWAYFLFEYDQIFDGSNYGCHPDGSFHALGQWYRKWDKSGFFQTTWSFGPMSFDSAKGADLAWDMVSWLLNIYLVPNAGALSVMKQSNFNIFSQAYP